ncbi:MAG: hypothetical protein Q9221_004746 [Calogaya cf. arnoldii]
MSLGDPGANRQRSFERRRPPGLFTHAPEPPPALRGGAGRHPGPMSPQSPPGLDHDFYPWAPAAPEVPISPTTTTTFSTLSSSASSSLDHWLPRVFAQNRPATPLHLSGQPSNCYGVDLPGASAKLAEEYVKLLEVNFEDGDLRVRLFQRESDHRARIHCRVSRNGRSIKQCCLPLAKLLVQRHASTLKLCRIEGSGRTKELWACLRFPSYERLVLFHCAFIALRSEDAEAEKPVGLLNDTDIHGEKSIYAGKIRDDEFAHALRVFRDRDCGAIRLLASVLTGELKRVPVWTAFITTHIESRRWMRMAGSKTIHLTDLQRYVFTDEYTPQLGPQGQHEIQFESSRDAKDFMDRVDELAEEQLQDYH